MQMWHICQECCPFNRPAARSAHPTLTPTEEPAFQPREATTAPLLTDLLAMSEEEFREKFRKSPVKRAKWRGMLHNIAAGLSTSDDPALKTALKAETCEGLIERSTELFTRQIFDRQLDNKKARRWIHMNDDPKLFEDESSTDDQDPDETPIANRTLITQPYDLVIESLFGQIRNNTLHLRPLSERPRFQRRFVWPRKLSSRLIESILLNVPIPPCYLSQNEQFELDAIDGQQRLMSIYMYLDNQFGLTGLEVLKELNSLRYHQLPERERNRLRTYTLRCVVITNDSHPEIKFDVFERLNTNTVTLNAQELRNCIHRGALNTLLAELTEYPPWLSILGRQYPDRRLRDEEVILRFFAFHLKGIDSYRTPQKHWLNEVAKEGRTFQDAKIAELQNVWKSNIDKCLVIFTPRECFRRLPVGHRPTVANRALMDLTMSSVTDMSMETVEEVKLKFYARYKNLIEDQEFDDLISKSIDHKKRTLRRYEIWSDKVLKGLV